MTQRPDWILGIGASAGGLDALKTLFDTMPVDTGAAFVVIQHLASGHQSLTPEILARHTSMTTVEAQQGMAIAPNHVYTIPSNAYLTVEDGVFNLGEVQPKQGLKMPIDAFFASLALQFTEHSLGLILSGSGNDGAEGVRLIKSSGGLVFCQSPETAEFDSMPRAAIATRMIDVVCPVDEMPERLVSVFSHSDVRSDDMIDAAETGGEDDDFKAILTLLRARYDIDFRNYKQGTLSRRIARRMALRQIEATAEYLHYLRDTPEEAEQLYYDLLISVTSFFRDPKAFHELDETVIKTLVASKSDNEPIRVWVAGCASGEEAYSIAILILEALVAARKYCPVQIFATDLDQHALDVGRSAVYPESIKDNIPPKLLSLYFEKRDNVYEARKNLRECITFARQDLTSDPPFSRIDLISCRNLLIYLQTDVQRNVLGYFHFALREDGFLFLGHSETVSQQEMVLFKPVRKSWRIFQRLPGVSSTYPKFPIGASFSRWRESETPAPSRPLDQQRLRELLQQRLVSNYAPAALLVNENNHVLYFSGPTNLYLGRPSGAPTQDVMAMVQRDLRPALRAALDRARAETNIVASENALISRGDTRVTAKITTHRLVVTGLKEPLLLVAFEDVQFEKPIAGEPIAEEALVPALEDELNQTRNDLQNSISGLEIANEELQAANEEVMSVNEELQSTNEELETSKEELQSMNEELTTVNNQLKDKAEQFALINDDLSNFVSSTGIATIFLDQDSNILRFTPATKRLYRVISTDVGRSIGDIRPRFDDESLPGDIEHVMETLQSVERVIVTVDESQYLRRIIPYRTSDDRIGGVVVTFIDVTERMRDEQKLKNNEARFRDYANAGASRFWETDKDNRFVWVNEGLAPDPTGERHSAMGRTRWELAGSDPETDPVWRDHLATLRSHKPFRDFEYKVATVNGSPNWWRESGVPFFDADGNYAGYRGTSRDITEYKTLEEKLRRAQRMEAIGHLTGGIAHDFNNLLAIVLGNIELLEREGAGSEDLDESLTAIKNAVRRGASMTNRLLAFGRVQTLLTKPINLADLITGIRPLLQRAVGETVTLNILHHDPEKTVLVDPNQLENALLNLAFNASAAMPEGGNLIIETSYVELDQHFRDAHLEAAIGSYICTKVADDGLGMTPEVLSKACEPFFTTKPVGEGSGLGLSMVYGFAIQSGGYMTIDSAVGTGTTVNLYMPVARQLQAVETSTVQAVPDFEGKFRVLLVEDEDQLRTVSKKLLESLGLKVVAVADGPSAIDQIKASSDFDLLMSDVVLPGGLTGWDIAAEFRQRLPDISVIICTGYEYEVPEDSVVKNARFLRKPFGRNELAAVTMELFGDQDPFVPEVP